MTQDSREKEIYRVTLWGGFVNFLLVVFKFIAGVAGNSAAMIADAVHSLSDFATDVVVMLFVHISGRPQDKGHGYGHGKFETLATACIGLALLAVGMGILWNGSTDILKVLSGETLPAPGMLALWAALISILLKELVYRFTVRVGHKVDSPAVIANAWHHRSDALSSVGTAVGIGGAILLGDAWHVLDPIAAIVVSFFILRVSVQLLHTCVGELTEGSLPEDVQNEIATITAEQEGVSEMHNLRTRRIGNHYAIEMHVRMDGNISLLQAHNRATAIERKLKERFGAETHVGIHVEPVKINGSYASENESAV